MELITTTSALEAFCRAVRAAPFMTLDTEFLRRETYYSKLCLIQVATPEVEAIIDPLADRLDLAPFLALLEEPSLLKVLHSARQDLEIFHQLLGGRLPQPVFDTQVAAMVCGYGDSTGYTVLVQGICGARVDKSQQATDWSRRPLSDAQLAYALADVTYLRDIYHTLEACLQEKDRYAWIAEEMAALTDPVAYVSDPETQWKRLKPRAREPRYLARLQAVAAWREREAEARNRARPRILRDDALLDLAATAPKNAHALAKVRGAGHLNAAQRDAVLAAIAEAGKRSIEECPRLPSKPSGPTPDSDVVSTLSLLLKYYAGREGVAGKLIASAEDIRTLARKGKSAGVPCLTTWRYDLFGRHALAFLNGDRVIRMKDGQLRVEER